MIATLSFFRSPPRSLCRRSRCRPLVDCVHACMHESWRPPRVCRLAGGVPLWRKTRRWWRRSEGEGRPRERREGARQGRLRGVLSEMKTGQADAAGERVEERKETQTSFVCVCVFLLSLLLWLISRKNRSALLRLTPGRPLPLSPSSAPSIALSPSSQVTFFSCAHTS